MERKISPLTFIFTALLLLGVILSASLLLPHDRYYRFQAHHDVTTRKADWIYERLHFDPTPIDVALIGTSRMAGGLSGPLIEKHYCAATKRKIHVANLAIPSTGRNMHYVIAKETARAKSPALFVVELNDVESRRPHNGFIFLADVKDVLNAPMSFNLNYFTDLFRLPGRQVSLFVETITGSPSIRAKFDEHTYTGPNFDRSVNITLIDGTVKSRRITHTADEMEAMRNARDAELSPLYLMPKALRPLEYRYAKTYLMKIEQQAKATNSKLTYAYLPAFGAPQISTGLLSTLNIFEPIIDLGGKIANDPSKWLDATHLNADGAREASIRFANTLITQYPKLGAAKSCD